MPYVKRVVVAGRTRETKKMYTPRVHTATERSKNVKHTPDAQRRVNERAAEERLRWKLNANFGYRDLHAVLHYSDKSRSLEDCIKDFELFKRRLRYACKKRGIALKYIGGTETKRMTNIHHHIVVGRMDPEIIAKAWEDVPGSGGISFRPMDRRGNHAALANYLIKETRSTVSRLENSQIRAKRFSSSQNLIIPEPVYTVIPAGSWKKEPKAEKGYVIMKQADGSSAKTGWHEVTGYAYQEYFEILIE